MKLEGTYTVSAPRDIVWQQLLSPQTLARAMPGCEKLEPNPDGSYRAELKIGIAAVKGAYHGRVEILEPVPPERFRMKVEGQGTGGFLRGDGTLHLAERDGGTVITYTGEAEVGGIIASVGQRLVLAAAKQIVHQFFEAFAREVRQAAQGQVP